MSVGQETLTNTLLPQKKASCNWLQMKTKVLALTAILILLFSTAVGLLLVKELKGNPHLDLGSLPPDSETKPPMVTIFSPMNDSASTTTPLTLSVNVTLPVSSTALGTILYFVICRTDWQENETHLYVNTGYANSVESQIPFDEHHYFQGSLNFEDVPDGNHSITVTAVAGGWYPSASVDYGFYYFSINGSSTVFFAVDSTPPSISVLSVENKTYYMGDIPLDFTLSEQVSQITYSLDEQKNVTISGNTTLKNLLYGEHNVTVYATDYAGNIGTSEMIYFTIADPFPTLLVATVIIVAVVFAVFLLMRKHKQSKI